MILVDTGAFYALIDKNDINHSDARKFYKNVIQQETLATTLPVLTEAWWLIEARLGSYFADKLWRSVSEGVFEMLEIAKEDLILAFEIETKYRDAGFGFVDSICFAVCEKYKIQKVFTYDRKHFKIFKPSFSKFLELLP